MLRRWGPRQCELRQLVYFPLNSSAEHSKSQRLSAEEQLLGNTERGSAARQPSCMRSKLHLPALDISWALQIVDSHTDMSIYLLVNAAVSTPDFVILPGHVHVLFTCWSKPFSNPAFGWSHFKLRGCSRTERLEVGLEARNLDAADAEQNTSQVIPVLLFTSSHTTGKRG